MDYFDYTRFDSSENRFTSTFDIQEFLQQSQQEQKDRIERELERISDQLEQRTMIHEETVQELESKLDWYVERLENLYARPVAVDDSRITELKTRIERFYTEIRTERREHWQDQQKLKRERRELFRELEEVDSQTAEEFLEQML